MRIDLGYDGTDFHGWAAQPGIRTVQGILVSGLDRVLGPDSYRNLTVAGRTDTGVHARGQVVHIDVDDENRLRARGLAPADPGFAALLLRRLSGALVRDPDVAIHGVRRVSDDFDARFSAIWRSYRYRISDRAATYDPVRRRDTFRCPYPLDVSAMEEAAHSLLGYGDWAAFCTPRPEATTWRTLQRFAWTRDDDGVLVAEVRADAFCHHMVRFLVGASVSVGRGRLRPEDLVRIRASGRHDPAVIVAPSHGLTLIAVGYPEEAGFAAQARRAMARRSPPPPEQ